VKRLAFQTFSLSLWKRSRAILGLVLIGIALAYVGIWFADQQGLRPGAGRAEEDFTVALLLIALPCIVAAASVLLANSDAENLYIALPPRTLRLPLHTWKIAAALVGFGAGMSALVALAATLPALWLFNVDFAWWLPVLTAATITVLAQLWAYTFGNAHPRVAIASFVLYFGALSWVARQPFFVRLSTGDGSVGGPLFLNLLLFAAAIALVGGLIGVVVRVQRHGGWSFGMPRVSVAATRRMTRKPFRSPRHAQFWFEWRQYGLLLPVYVGGVAAAYFIGLPLVVGVFRISDVTGGSSNEPLFHIDWFTSAQFITTGLGLAALIGGIMVGGVMFMRAGHWNSQSNYLLTRPLTLARIADARVYVMLASACAALALLLGLVGLLELVTRLQGETTGLGPFLYQGYEALPKTLVYTVFWGALLLMMWTFAWSASYVYILGIFAVLVVPPMSVVWAGALFGITSIESAQGITERLLPYLYWSGSILCIAGLLGMAWRANTRNLLHPAIPTLSVLAWIAYSYVFIEYVEKWDVGIQAQDWATRFPHPVEWSVWVGASILPLVPLYLHPLLLERIRHQ